MARLALAMTLVLAVSAILAGCGASSSEPECKAEFSAFPTTGYAPSQVQLTDLSTGDFDTWEWDFDGDGVVDSTLENPRHTYTAPGTYTVSLTVRGPAGTYTETKEGYLVFAPYPCRAAFVAEPTAVAGTGTVRFTDQSTGKVTGWAWDFDNDGETDSTEQNPTFTYTEYGRHTVTLRVTAPQCQDKLTKTDYIEYVAPPEAQFTGTPTSGYAPKEVQFTDLSTGEIDTWEWDFESDGAVDSTGENPVHEYRMPGSYTVSLTVRGFGGNDTETKVAYLGFAAPPCIADFVASPRTAEYPNTTVQFTDQSLGDIKSWAWDLNGDGITDRTEQNPIYTYASRNATYSVTLTVTTLYCEDSVTKTDYIHVSGCPG